MQRAILEVVIGQVSKQKSIIEQLLMRIAAMEESNQKHQMLIDQMIYKVSGSCALNKVNQEGLSSLTKKLNKKLPFSRSPVVKRVPRKRLRAQPVKFKAGSDNQITEGSIKRITQQKFKESLPKKQNNYPTKLCCINVAGAPIAKPITLNRGVFSLSSWKNDTKSLASIDEVLCKYNCYIVGGKITALARRLAAEAVFGNDVLKQCTLKGMRQFPALPTDLLYVIKQTLLNTFPSYWDNPAQFEIMWDKEYAPGINSLCKSRRHIKPSVRSKLTKSPLQPTVRPIHSLNALPSSIIDKTKLMNFDEFMSFHSCTIRSGRYKMYYWCRLLARDVYFGTDVLKQCRGDHLSLPTLELNLLKQAVLSCFSCDQDEFERQWDSNGIHKVCAYFR